MKTEGSKIINLDVLEGLSLIPSESIDCIITSPPYWNLRTYGSDDEIGSEKTSEEYIMRLTNIFVLCKRILKPAGTMWINLGDSYGKNKELLLLPSKLAISLQENGWILRNDIIWHKPNPMPQAVKDRLTNCYEHIFFFVKNKTYFYDQDSIRVPVKRGTPQAERDYKRMLKGRQEFNGLRANNKNKGQNSFVGGDPLKGANKKDVWTVTTTSSKKVHFATFPEELIRPCIKAGCPKGGIVLDIFAGTGTTMKVALQEQRQSIAIELNSEYIEYIENIKKNGVQEVLL